MLPPEMLAKITACAQEFDASVVWLFGSAMGDIDKAHDIDLAVEGVPDGKVFDMYCRLSDVIEKEIDLVDLSVNPPIRHIIWERGVRIYERAK